MLWAIAVILLVVGTYGLLGQEKDPLSAVFLIPIGLPWVFWIDGLSEPLRPIAAIFAPLINIAVLWLICRVLWKSRAEDHERRNT